MAETGPITMNECERDILQLTGTARPRVGNADIKTLSYYFTVRPASFHGLDVTVSTWVCFWPLCRTVAIFERWGNHGTQAQPRVHADVAHCCFPVYL
jgi:hypothetical protein